ncbi:MAG: metalloregulator ArsR/SmtB family transcription factor [Anaerolineales bacterium]
MSMDDHMIERAKRQATLCRLFGNPCRLMIFWSLGSGELAVNEIAARVGSSLQNVSQHLGLLKRRNLIVPRRDGQHIYYRINESALPSNCLAMSAIGDHGLPQHEITIRNGGTR